MIFESCKNGSVHTCSPKVRLILNKIDSLTTYGMNYYDSQSMSFDLTVTVQMRDGHHLLLNIKVALCLQIDNTA